MVFSSMGVLLSAIEGIFSRSLLKNSGIFYSRKERPFHFRNFSSHFISRSYSILDEKIEETPENFEILKNSEKKLKKP
jgi:hypothetical protein